MVKQFLFPANATPIEDCSGLLLEWVHTLSDLNRVEAENILKAQRKYLRPPIANPVQWFQVPVLKKIHQAMFSEVWSWAGLFRKSVTTIGLAPNLISARLGQLLSSGSSVD